MALTAVATPLTDNIPFAVLGESLSVTAGAELTEIYGNYTYAVESDGTVTIVTYNEDEETVEIPSAINGITVTRIAHDAFAGKSALKNVIIPDTVTCIYQDAFLNCPELRTVTVPASVTDIGMYAMGYRYD